MAKSRKEKRIRRKISIRKKLSGTASKPRVFVFRSSKYIYVGVADDSTGKVLFSKKSSKNVESSKKLGLEVGAELKKNKLETVVFDRSGYRYHGKIAAVADGIRESGIKV